MERTLSIVKPDGVGQKVIGEVIRRFEANGLKILGLKMVHMSKREAEGFYVVHKDKPFYGSLTDFMSSGPAVIMALEGEDAIRKVRDIMGPTDSTKAPKGTIRGDYGFSIEKNIIHGSDSPESAKFEIPYFFNALELFDR
ncbi:MAG: nucleoside-diphosphate kinase [Acidobacteriota bacterium]